MKILFIIRKSRINAKGECPINCRVTLNGIQAAPFSTGLFLPPKKWNAAAQFAKDRIVNDELHRIRAELTEIFLDMRRDNRYFSAEDIVARFRNGAPKLIGWAEIIQEYVERLRQRNKSPRTIQAYKRHIVRFSEWTKMSPTMVDRQEMKKYYDTLLSSDFSLDYCNKTIQAIFGFFKFLIGRGIIQVNPCQGLGLEWENREDNTFLNQAELLCLINTEWTAPIQKTVDAFLFMCYSGMHVSDYLAIGPGNIQTSEKGQYLAYCREKNGQNAEVPLNPVLAGLMLKYGGIENLPKQAAQKMNIYLKVVAERIGTKKRLTNKVARKTFTDISLNIRKMPEEDVARMLGHKTTKYLAKYGKIRIERILEDWNNDDLVTQSL